jgi:transaldolase
MKNAKRSAGTNALCAIRSLGQSIWLDYLRRDLVRSGGLAQLIRADGLAGVTSNPAIFEKAIAGGREYEAPIRELGARGLPATAIYETLALEDVSRAAELLRPVHGRTGGRDGFVSLEISPHLAGDAEQTVAEAQRLWGRLGRANVMIKVPATHAGVSAVRRLIAIGVNVNVTLLFSVERYREVTEAYLAGLEDRVRVGVPLDSVASVASFFLSRIDTLVDRRLDALESEAARALRGQSAIACARLAYDAYRQLIAGSRWQVLAAQGARPQRLLWASTSTKDPAYADVKYVEALIGQDTVNTLPPETLAAYRDHGQPAARLGDELAAARALPDRLAALGINLEQVAQQLEEEGVRKFVEPYDRLLATIEGLRREATS